MCADESATTGLPDLSRFGKDEAADQDTADDVATRIGDLEAIRTENGDRLMSLAQSGAMMMPDPFDQERILELLRGLLRVVAGEDALLDLEIYVEGRVSEKLSKIEAASRTSALTQGVSPLPNRAQRRHG